MKKKLAIFISVAIGILSACEKQELTPRQTDLSSQDNTQHNQRTAEDPANPSNPYDFAGVALKNAMSHASAAENVNQYRIKVGEYFLNNPLQPFDVQSPLSTKEITMLKSFARHDHLIESNLNEFIRIAKAYETRVANDRSLSANEKQRVLYILSSVKHGMYYLDEEEAPIEGSEALTVTMEIVKFNLLDPGGNGPDGRRFWGKECETHLVGQEGACATISICQKYIFWIKIGDPKPTDPVSAPCP